MLPDTASNRQHTTYLQMLGLAAVEDAVRIRVYVEHLEEAADYLRLMGVSWEVCIEDVSQYLVRERPEPSTAYCTGPSAAGTVKTFIL